MNKLSFRYCPICSKELDTGKIKLPAPHSMLALLECKGEYYSYKTKEKYAEHPIKNLFRGCDKEFIIQTLGEENPAGYCKECNRIFAEFEIID